MTLANRQGAFTLWTVEFDLGVQSVESDGHIRRIGGDAGVRRHRALIGLAENGHDAIEADYRATAGAGFALVAGREGDIGEVVAAGALHQVAARGGHIAQLRAGAGKQSEGKQRVVLNDALMVGKV